MKPIVFKHSTNHWYTFYRDSKGKLRFSMSASWHWAIIDALAYADMAQSRRDCE